MANRKIVAVIGVPGTGKTTLMREFMGPYEWEKQDLKKLIPTLYSKEKDIQLIGRYEPGVVFAGTDILSLAVMPMAKEFIQETKSNILFEGDRLTSMNFFEFCSELPDTELTIVYLTVPDNILQERYAERGSEQSEVFLKGRHTKISNINSNFALMEFINEFEHLTPEDTEKVVTFINGVFAQ